MKRFTRIAIGTLLVLCMFTASSFFDVFKEEQISVSKSEYEAFQNFKEMFDVYKVINERYYIEPENKKLVEGAIRGMLSGLDDPYSIYYNSEEFKDYWEDDSGEYAGVGMQIASKLDENICVITRVFKGSPAEEAGIKKGDIFVQAGDIKVSPKNLQEAVDFIRGEIGTKVKLTMLRGSEEIVLDVERRKVNINRVDYTMLDGNIGLIQLYEFSGESGKEFKNAMGKLLEQGAKGLVIDLRDNPGGWVNNAKEIADLFIENDTLCYFQYRDGSKEYIKTGKGKLHIPMSIVINEFSASASELFSGAMQDYGRADIVGNVSYGKGIAQEIQDVGDEGAGFQYTVAQYFTPKGQKVHKVGIQPDYLIKVPYDEYKEYQFASMDDPQLKKAYELVLNKIKK